MVYLNENCLSRSMQQIHDCNKKVYWRKSNSWKNQIKIARGFSYEKSQKFYQKVTCH